MFIRKGLQKPPAAQKKCNISSMCPSNYIIQLFHQATSNRTLIMNKADYENISAYFRSIYDVMLRTKDFN